MTYLDAWRSGTFFLYSCKAAFLIQETSPIARLSDVERSVVLQPVFAIGSALAYLLFSLCAFTQGENLTPLGRIKRRLRYEAKLAS